MFDNLILPEWRTLDVLERAESTIHKVVRLREPGASPPKLTCARIDLDCVEIVYTSERRLCALAVGLTRGIARHYGEVVHVEEPECMQRGHARCRILCRVA